MAKSMKVPKGWEDSFAALTALTDRFCDEHLTAEYAELARYGIAGLCRKRPSPLSSANPRTWACAVLYAIGQVNFPHDKASAPYMSMADFAAISESAPAPAATRQSWSGTLWPLANSIMSGHYPAAWAAVQRCG